MHIDFWNNPIVVSAFRVKYRRGGVFNITTLWVLLLVTGGALFARFADPAVVGSWPRNYLLALLVIQFITSALLAGNATSDSIRTEVMNRTLDFQRITALSPAQIVLGKLLGEPALAYLLAIATVPLAAYCWTLGVAGVSLGVLFLLYVNLASNTFLLGTLGMLQRLEPGSKRSGRSPMSLLFVVVLACIALPPLTTKASAILSVPWSAAVVGLLTPIPAFFGLYTANPWGPHLSFFDLPIPMLLVTPLSQFALALLCFHTMVRRLVNPLDTSLGKGLGYLILLAMDVMTAAVLLEPLPLGMAIVPRVAAFCLVHLLVGLWLMNSVTPWRESLHSWVWRFRGRTPRLWDWWLGERSENVLALVTFCVIGNLCLALLVLLPAGLQDGFAPIRRSGPVLASVVITTTLLMLTFGTLHQWFVFIAGRNGKAALATLMVIIILPLQLVGEYYHSAFLLALSPTAHFGRWLSGGYLPHLEYLLVVCAGLLLWSWLALRRRIRRLEEITDQKLLQMGVTKAKASLV
jgi:hypothetical protein